jgi:CubicO group peptidase (beta-lactamase class C family)
MALQRSAVIDACAYFDTWLAYRRRLDRIPGIQAAVLHDGDVVLETAHGLADVEAGIALTTTHRFRIASHSKTFTATAVVRLAEQGVLRLDDTLGQWLPDLATADIAGATLRELLAHGGGLVRDGRDGDHWQLVRPFPDATTLARIAVDDGAVLRRNERFKYSNIGFSLLGAVIEAATGEPYADHVRTALLDPLGLTATTPDIDLAVGDDVAGHATGYTSLSYAAERIPIDHVATGAMAAATGFSSTASDVVRWAAAHFMGDERILPDDAKRAMQHTQWEVAASGEYALGFQVADLGGRRVLGHGGGFPGFITHTWFDPLDRLAVSVLTNTIDGAAQTAATLAVRLIGLAQEGLDGAPPDAGPPVADPARYTGRFTALWGSFDIVALGGRLYGLTPSVDDPLPARQRLAVVDDDTLRMVDGPGYGSSGEPVAYTRDPDGVVVAVRGGSGSIALPDDQFRASLEGRDRIRRGETPTEREHDQVVDRGTPPP